MIDSIPILVWTNPCALILDGKRKYKCQIILSLQSTCKDSNTAVYIFTDQRHQIILLFQNSILPRNTNHWLQNSNIPSQQNKPVSIPKIETMVSESTTILIFQKAQRTKEQKRLTFIL